MTKTKGQSPNSKFGIRNPKFLGGTAMQILRQDLRYGARMLLKQPLFTIVAIATLALGIGANSAIFSVVNAVLLRSLPYHKADQLIVLSTTTSSGDMDGLSQLEAQDYRSGMQSVEDLATFQSQSVNVTGGERPDRIRGAFNSANFFSFFNLTPIAARTFVDGEDQRGAAKLVVVNEKMWRERFEKDPKIEIKKVSVYRATHRVIGDLSPTL